MRALKIRRVLGVLAAVACAAAFSGTPAVASSANPGVISPSGDSYGALSAGWWQYVLENPKNSVPLNDRTGAHCADGQTGQVFFLVGTAGTGTATRNQCTAPAGEPLFFPLANAFDVHTPGDGLDTPQAVWKDLQITNGFQVTEAHATVDGVPITDLNPHTTPYRGCAGGPMASCAPSFALNLPARNLFGLTPGVYEPADADGVYLLLAPLSPGQHTIEFGGAGNLGGPFSQETTYSLTIQ